MTDNPSVLHIAFYGVIIVGIGFFTKLNFLQWVGVLVILAPIFNFLLGLLVDTIGNLKGD